MAVQLLEDENDSMLTAGTGFLADAHRHGANFAPISMNNNNNNK